jgi:tetratricopeptide (TPR) repeat protein
MGGLFDSGYTSHLNSGYNALGNPQKKYDRLLHREMTLMPQIKGSMPLSPLGKASRLYRQGQFDQADDIYLTVLNKEPENAVALHFHGLIEARRNHKESALELLQKALQLQPEKAHFHHNSAGVYARLGLKESAINHFQEAIRLKPDYAEAYQGLTECRSFKDDQQLLSTIILQLDSETLSDMDRSYMHFAAAKICADSEDYDRAFEHYRKANQFRGIRFSSKQYTRLIDYQIKQFSPKFISERAEWGLFDHTPIFVLGMPRSGTTLVEQILASHNDVYGAGELNDMRRIGEAIERFSDGNTPYPLCLESAPQNRLLELGIEYLNRLKALSNGVKRVVDKNPHNFRHVGLILLMFPNAKIIHTNRNPIDTCLSCFFQSFTKGQEYSFSLDDLAIFYNGYRKIMQHWKRLFPDRIYDIQYEELISDQERTSRSLLEFCELPWDESCLDFHKIERNVITASKFQVRKPIYKTSVQRWKKYENHLQPLVDKLDL